MSDLLDRATLYCTPFYQAPQRAYHTLTHVQAMLDALQDRSVLSVPLALAVWGHDLIYDSQRHDNETQSAQLFGDWLTAQDAGAGLVTEVRRLILETRHTAPPTDRTAALLIDADLSVFGSDDKTYWAYEQAIRQEYAWADWPHYRTGRMSVLDGFLKREQVYQTLEFAGLEAAARRHLRAAWGLLAGSTEESAAQYSWAALQQRMD